MGFKLIDGYDAQRNTKIAIFILPTLFLWLMFMTLTVLPWFTGIILAMALFFAMHHVSFLECANASPQL